MTIDLVKYHDLLEFVKGHHGDQKRKYTDEPYYNHVISVAEIAAKYVKHPFVVEIALCHDLFEDTECTWESLTKALQILGYKESEAFFIADMVDDLSDRFTHKDYPKLNREKRKQFEAQRMGVIDPLAQSIKYADLIDNTRSIVEHDKGFARVYLREKERILNEMKGGNPELRKRCIESLIEAKKKLDDNKAEVV